jgi:hypothetical protein
MLEGCPTCLCFPIAQLISMEEASHWLADTQASCGHSPHGRCWLRQSKFPKSWFASQSWRDWSPKKSSVNFLLFIYYFISKFLTGILCAVFGGKFLFSRARNSVDPDGSLSCSQNPSTGHYPETPESSPTLIYWPLLWSFPTNISYPSHFPLACYIYCPSHPFRSCRPIGLLCELYQLWNCNLLFIKTSIGIARTYQ